MKVKPNKENKLFELKELFINKLDNCFDNYEKNNNLDLNKLLFSAHSLSYKLMVDISILIKEV